MRCSIRMGDVMSEIITNEQIIEIIKTECGNDQRIMQCVDNVMNDSILTEDSRRAALYKIMKYPADMAVYFFGRGE